MHASAARLLCRPRKVEAGACARRPLRSYLETSAPSPSEALTLICAAMRGTAAARRQGIVHRDIKPDNIFLARGEDAAPALPKVLDFGISKLLVLDSGELKLTATGAPFGTALYKSYEQLAGRAALDARADVYSFGVIVYEALWAPSIRRLLVSAADRQVHDQ